MYILLRPVLHVRMFRLSRFVIMNVKIRYKHRQLNVEKDGDGIKLSVVFQIYTRHVIS